MLPAVQGGDRGGELGGGDGVAGADQELVEQVGRGQRIGVASPFGRGVLARAANFRFRPSVLARVSQYWVPV